MTDYELTRAPGERRRYSLGQVGTLQFGGWSSRSATAEVAGREWRFARSGLLRAKVKATDAVGTVVGEFAATAMARGGTLRWQEQELELRPASKWRERYALAHGERELVLLDGKGWGRRPVKVTVEDIAAVEPALLLFSAYVVNALAEDAGAAAATAAV
jgi:hypothetical protein